MSLIRHKRTTMYKNNSRNNGDRSKGRREFETIPSINECVGTIEYSVWNSTAPIPKLHSESYITAAKQFTVLLEEMKTLHKTIETLERELEINGAPYTPGRWPKWGEN